MNLPEPDAFITTAAVLAGSSPAAERLRLQVARFGPHFRNVLLVGEAGTGKRCLAAELHGSSPAAASPFVALTAEEFVVGDPLSSRFFYLQGLADLKPILRARLAEKLCQLPRDMRVVLGCDATPSGLAMAARLRGEASGRAGLLEIAVPPLRERLEDLSAIAAQLLGWSGDLRFTDQQLTALSAHLWSGNLAEFATVCKEFARTGEIHLNHGSVAPVETMQRLDRVVSEHVLRVIEHCAGNKFRAAEILGISRSTLYRML